MSGKRHVVLGSACIAMLTAVLLGACSGGATGAATAPSPTPALVAPSGEGGSPSNTPSGTPATTRALPASVRFDSTTVLPAYTAKSTLEAAACDGVHGTWSGTLTIDQPYISDGTQPVAWDFDAVGKATVKAGPFHENLNGPQTASFLIRLHLVDADGGAPAVVVDDVIQVQPGYPDTSLAPYSTNYGTPRAVRLGPIAGCA
jgi:hypothetical protein